MLWRIGSATLLWVTFVFSEGLYCQQAGTTVEVSALPALIGMMTGVYNFNNLITSNDKTDIHSLPRHSRYLQTPDTRTNPQHKKRSHNKITSSGHSQPVQPNSQSSFSGPSGSGGGGDGDGDGGKPPEDQQRKPADYLPEPKQKQDLLDNLIVILRRSLEIDNDELIRYFASHPGFQQSFSVQDAHYILDRLQGIQIPESNLSILPKVLREAYQAKNSRKIRQQPPKRAAKKEERQTPSQTTSSTDKHPPSSQGKSSTKRTQFKPLPMEPPGRQPDKKILPRDQRFSTITAQGGNTPVAQQNQPANPAEEEAFSGNYEEQFPNLPAPQPTERVKVPKILKIPRPTQQQPAADSMAQASGAAGQQSTDTNTNRGKAKTPSHKQGHNQQPETHNAPEEPTVSNGNALPAASTPSTSDTEVRRKKRDKNRYSLPKLKVLSKEDEAAISKKNKEEEQKQKIAFEKKQKKIKEKLEKKQKDQNARQMAQNQHQQQPSASLATSSDSQPSTSSTQPPSDKKSGKNTKKKGNKKSKNMAASDRQESAQVSSLTEDTQNPSPVETPETRTVTDQADTTKAQPEEKEKRKKKRKKANKPDKRTSEVHSSFPSTSGEPAVQERSLEQAYQYFRENDSSSYQIWNAISGVIDQYIQNHNHLPGQLETLIWIVARENQLALQALFQLHYTGQLNRPLRLLRTLLYFFANRQELLQTIGNNNASLPWVVATTTSGSQRQYNETGWEDFSTQLLKLFSQPETVMFSPENPADGNYIPGLLQWFQDRGLHLISSRRDLPSYLRQLTQDFLQDNSLLPSVMLRIRKRVVYMIFLAQEVQRQESTHDENAGQGQVHERMRLENYYRETMEWTERLLPNLRQNNLWGGNGSLELIQASLDGHTAGTFASALGFYSSLPQSELNLLSLQCLQSAPDIVRHYCIFCHNYNAEPYQYFCENQQHNHVFFMHKDCDTEERSGSIISRHCRGGTDPSNLCPYEARGYRDTWKINDTERSIRTFQAIETLSSAELSLQSQNTDDSHIDLEEFSRLLAVRANNPQFLQSIEQWLTLEFFDGGRKLLSRLMGQLTLLRTDDNDPKLLDLIEKIRRQLSKNSL
ncbi:hypothetical protein [Endozoicomonas euniceicola]|uniref:Uncharacterized protein n=1 Tax=Endozoicomonas euniceicola TaxID=1234143 RepID=A0ABY6GWT8_9GAMM|nr:hypothetical protein [Endozoicomonas euniceicola]UYM16541.1 hypothetical protein NX720_00980 [Endozoicomonas euniceicola]